MKAAANQCRAALRVLPAAVAMAVSGGVWASGFAVSTQNASGLGHSYAGAAATAEDASTIFYNPAGLAYIEGKQVVLGANVVQVSAKFENRSSVGATGVPFGGGGGDAGGTKLIPYGYFSMPLSDRLVFGLGVGAPFGNATEWDNDWVGRFQGTKSELKTFNLNPTLAYKVNDKLSLGFGVNYQKGEAEFQQKVNGVAVNVAFNGSEATAVFKVDDDQWGWNVGAMYQPSEATRMGVSYRSKIKYRMTGTARYTSSNAALSAALAGAGSNSDIFVDLYMPDSFSLAVAQKISPRWEVLGDLTWTGWSVLQSLKAVRTSGTANGAVAVDIPYQWKDAWRLGLGANYAYSQTTTLKFGFAYDQSPANDVYRTVTLPDSDRYWVSFGVKKKMSKQSSIDVGYAHEFIKDGSVNSNRGGNNVSSTTAFGLVNGDMKKHINIIGVQYTYNF